MKKTIITTLITFIILTLSTSGFTGSIFKNGNLKINPKSRVEDIVVKDGKVVIEGVVKGKIYTIDSKVNLTNKAVVLGSMTINRGRLYISNGATLPEEIVLVNSYFYLDGKRIEPEGSDEIALNDDTIVKFISSNSVNKVLNFTKKFIIFNRDVPSNDFPVDDLFDLDLSSEGFSVDDYGKLFGSWSAANLFSINLPEDYVSEVGYKKFSSDDKSVDTYFFKFHSEEKAKTFGEKIHSSVEDYLNQTIFVSFGDGFHWFFNYDDYQLFFWQKNNWIIGVIVGVSDSSELGTATIDNITLKVINKIKSIIQ